MKIGILNADAVKTEFVAEFGEYPDMFSRLLLEVDPDTEFVIYAVMNGEYYDDVVWINELKDFVRKLHGAKKKLVGICFGHQLVAEALGGKTRQASQGWCVGVHKAKLTVDAAAYGPADAEFQLLSNHKDQVEKMAIGAELLASTDACPITMTQLGGHILTFQGHAEFDKGYALGLLNMRREILGESVYQTAVDTLPQTTDNSQVARWVLDFVGT
jgi:GMP synthase-like glutamine amidotransferase